MTPSIFFKRGPRRQNPETPITREIRSILDIMDIPHYKNWGGPMSMPGIADISGVIPGETVTTLEDGSIRVHPAGRALWIEIKTATGKASEAQQSFLKIMKDAGAIAFVARSMEDVLAELTAARFAPAIRITTRQQRRSA